MKQKGCGCNKHLELRPPLDDWDKPFIPELPDCIESFSPIPLPDPAPLVVIQNMADEEDLTAVDVEDKTVLKFKDKDYSPIYYSGLGRVFLRKNLQENTSLECGIRQINVLTQDMFYDDYRSLKENTIFIVQYDYDLKGNYITIPKDSVLLFLGGSFNNGTIILQNTLVLPLLSNFLDYIKCNIRGNFKNGQTFYDGDNLKYWNNNQWNVIGESSKSDLENIVKELREADSELLKKINAEKNNLTNTIASIDARVLTNETNISALGETLRKNYPTRGEFATINNKSLFGTTNILIEANCPRATNKEYGGFKTGYTKNGSKLPVQLTVEGQAYVDAYGIGGGNSGSGSGGVDPETAARVDELNTTIEKWKTYLTDTILSDLANHINYINRFKTSITEADWGLVKAIINNFDSKVLSTQVGIVDKNGNVQVSTLEQTINTIISRVDSLRILENGTTQEDIFTYITLQIDEGWGGKIELAVLASLTSVKGNITELLTWRASFLLEVDIQNGTSLTSILNSYLRNNSTILSGIESYIDSNNGTAKLTGFVTNAVTKAGFLLENDLDEAIATLIATDDNQSIAAITAKVQDGLSLVIIDAAFTNINSRDINLGNGIINIKSEGNTYNGYGTINLGGCSRITVEKNLLPRNSKTLRYAQIFLHNEVYKSVIDGDISNETGGQCDLSSGVKLNPNRIEITGTNFNEDTHYNHAITSQGMWCRDAASLSKVSSNPDHETYITPASISLTSIPTDIINVSEYYAHLTAAGIIFNTSNSDGQTIQRTWIGGGEIEVRDGNKEIVIYPDGISFITYDHNVFTENDPHTTVSSRSVNGTLELGNGVTITVTHGIITNISGGVVTDSMD